jgi:hypothetical protein
MAEPLCMSCIHPECEYAGKDVRLFICLHEYTRKPPTNADRIRAMSDEELALAILMTANCDLCPIKNCKARHYSSPDNCERHWLDWLKSPAGGTE